MRRRTQRRAFSSKRGEQRRIALHPDDHDLGGFYQGRDGLAVFQAHFPDGIGGDDGRNPLATDGKRNLGHQAADLDVGNTPDELVPAADASKVRATLRNFLTFRRPIQKSIDFLLRNSVMAARRLHRANLFLIYPLFQCGVADSQYLCSIARREQFVCRHNDLLGFLDWDYGPPKRSERLPMVSPAVRGVNPSSQRFVPLTIAA